VGQKSITRKGVQSNRARRRKKMTFRMSRDDVVQEFEIYNLADIKRRYEKDGVPDYIARSEEWNNYTDYLCQEGRITQEQYDTWDHPDCCNAPWE
jgi:CRISPR/Cas system-associated endonuclease Cas1